MSKARRTGFGRRRVLIGAGAALGGLALGRLPVRAQEQVLKLKWDQLMPSAPPKVPKTFFSGRAPLDPTQPPPGPDIGPEGRWLSRPGGQAASVPAPVVEALNGKRVEIGGYIVPLDFEATSVKEFLLVPFVGACVHVPPPPANQIVFVAAAKGFAIKSMFEPVTVVGVMRTEIAHTGLADAGYKIEADRVEKRKE